MSHERPDAPRANARRPEHTDTGRARAIRPETGSVWWAEVALGAMCSLTAAVVVLATTTLGPFADLTVTYGPAFTLSYLAVAAVIGLGFLASGLRSSPYLGGSPAGVSESVRPERDA